MPMADNITLQVIKSLHFSAIYGMPEEIDNLAGMNVFLTIIVISLVIYILSLKMV